MQYVCAIYSIPNIIFLTNSTYTVKSFWEFINELIEIFQWIMVSMIPFVTIPAFIRWFTMNCHVLINKIHY